MEHGAASNSCDRTATHRLIGRTCDSSCRESVSIRIWGISPRWGTRPCAREFTMAYRVRYGGLGRAILLDATLPAHERSSAEYRQMIRRGTVRIGGLDAFSRVIFVFHCSATGGTPTSRTNKIAGRMLLRYFSYLSLINSRLFFAIFHAFKVFLKEGKSVIGQLLPDRRHQGVFSCHRPL